MNQKIVCLFDFTSCSAGLSVRVQKEARAGAGRGPEDPAGKAQMLYSHLKPNKSSDSTS